MSGRQYFPPEITNATPAERTYTVQFRPTAKEMGRWLAESSDHAQVEILKAWHAATEGFCWPMQCRAIEIAFGQESTFEVKHMLETLVDHLGDRSTISAPGMRTET